MADRVEIGARFDRWTVLRLAAPRNGRRACVVRCRCGCERRIEERRLTSGDSSGCPSPQCRIEAQTLRQLIEDMQAKLEGAS